MDGPRSPRAPIALTAALLALGLVPGRAAPGWAAKLGDALRDDGPNRADLERRERGYYETLLDAGRSLGRLDVAPRRKDHKSPDAVPFDAGPLATAVNDVREYVLKPNISMDHWGVSWTTNALGLRDRPHERTKPARTWRIALIGDSIGAGWAVPDGSGFEPKLEEALDAGSQSAGGPAVEILNFAVPGLAPGQRWESFVRAGGWETGPDLLIYEATLAEQNWDERRLRSLLPRGLGLDAPAYRDALARLGARPGADAEAYKALLRPHRRAILGGVYRTVASECRARGVPALFVLVPRVGKGADPDERRRMLDLARAAGFVATIDLSDAYDGRDPAGLAVAPDDYHPNAEGHAILARRLEAALRGRPELARIGPVFQAEEPR